jgi:two-component system, OmpR family, response regulator
LSADVPADDPAFRVLVVDDDRVNGMLFEQACRLAAERLVVEVAANGAEALALARDWQPQALVIDLHLPDTDGLALLPALRAAVIRPCAAWLCTADDPGPLLAAAEAAGFDGCWAKPLDVPAMLALLETAARQAHGPAAEA